MMRTLRLVAVLGVLLGCSASHVGMDAGVDARVDGGPTCSDFPSVECFGDEAPLCCMTGPNVEPECQPDGTWACPPWSADNCDCFTPPDAGP